MEEIQLEILTINAVVSKQNISKNFEIRHEIVVYTISFPSFCFQLPVCKKVEETWK